MIKVSIASKAILFGAVAVLMVVLAPGFAFSGAVGSANVPTGVAQFSSLLSGYRTRPEWKVAGVDYYVGTPSGAALKDPTTISIAGVSVDSSAHVITVKVSNVTLSGYNFGLNGGWQVNVVNNASDVTIRDSYFRVGKNNLMPIQAYYGGTVNVLNNTFDGGASLGSSVNAMVFTGSGGATIEYNRFTNFPDDGIDVTRDGDFVIRNNMFDTMGAGDFHTDAIQTYFSALSSLSIEFNTMYQPPGELKNSINAFVRIGDQKGNVVHNALAAYNTIIMASTTAQTANVFQWDVDGRATLVNPQIHDNFIDPTGVLYSIISPTLQNPDGVVNPVTYNNVNLNTGRQLLSGPWNNQTTGVPARPPTTPIIASGHPVGATRAKLAGTAIAQATVAIYDGSVLLGTAEPGLGGAWSFVTPELADGRHSITARATTGLTNSSASSVALIIAVTSSGIDAKDTPANPGEHVLIEPAARAATAK